jgi:hypothetical protein
MYTHTSAERGEIFKSLTLSLTYTYTHTHTRNKKRRADERKKGGKFESPELWEKEHLIHQQVLLLLLLLLLSFLFFFSLL